MLTPVSQDRSSNRTCRIRQRCNVHEHQSSHDSSGPTYAEGKHQTRPQSYVSAIPVFNANDVPHVFCE